jgi:hypothetical protein
MANPPRSRQAPAAAAHKATKIFGALILILVLSTSNVRAEIYLSVLDDVPVMPGLTEQANESVIFEAASGRIVTAVTSGAKRLGLDMGAALGFYAATLPALGWHAESPSRFTRDGEVMTLRVEQAQGRLTLRFDLRPR